MTSYKTATHSLHDQIQVAATTIRHKIGSRSPTVGLVLGSGLGAFADHLAEGVALDFADVPRFPISTIAGHAGRLVVGKHGKLMCAALQGRVHYYEGYDMARVTFAVRTLMALGVKTFVLTNAAGGVDPSLVPGEIVILKDHLNLMPENPLRGEHDERFGPRFPDMTQAYDPALRAIAARAGTSLGLTMREGIYAALPGPSYETPAEVRMVRGLGADLVGMSTIPEVLVARQQGARVLALSCVTNLAAGITGSPLSHEEVTETATRVRNTFTSLLGKILDGIAEAA